MSERRTTIGGLPVPISAISPVPDSGRLQAMNGSQSRRHAKFESGAALDGTAAAAHLCLTPMSVRYRSSAA